MAFNKKRADDRKAWLSRFEPGTFMNFDVKEIQYGDFVNKELILFSLSDNQRSIPSMVDGMKVVHFRFAIKHILMYFSRHSVKFCMDVSSASLSKRSKLHSLQAMCLSIVHITMVKYLYVGQSLIWRKTLLGAITSTYCFPMASLGHV
jgi:hypothetical protein